MRPAFLNDMSQAMADVYGATTDKILINLARYFKYAQMGAEIPGAFEYQARMLAQMGQVNRETVQIIMNSLGSADEALKASLEAAILDALKNEEPKLQRAAKQGLLWASPPSPEITPNQMQAFQAYYKQSADKLNLVNTVMLESTEAAYRATVADVTQRIQRTQGILNTATGEVVTGVTSYNQAVRDAVRKMVDNGLTGFVDHGGHRWSPEAYAAMDIKTTMFNTARAAVWEREEEYGCDTYQVSSHNGARPLCYPWQGKVISRTDNVREIEDLDGNKIHVYAQSETSYGAAAGLFGINCGHYPMTFIPGFSTMKGEPQDPEENEKTYAESQQQRALERKLREEKRDLEVLKAQGAPDEQIKAQKEKVKQASAAIDDFCDETGRTRRRDREGTPVNAKFPPKDSYDPAEFPTQTRDQMADWFSNGGTDGTPPQSIHLKPDDIPPSAQAQIPINEAEKQAFTPAKTREEAEQYARDHFAKDVDYNGMSLKNANTVNETLTELTEKYPINQLGHISQVPQGSVARANYDHLEINGKGLGKVLDKDMQLFLKGQEESRELIEQIKSRYAGRAKLPFGAENAIEKLEKNLRYSRYGVHASYENHVRATIIHEYGHILSDQYFGMVNAERANANYATNWALRSMNQKWDAAFTKAKTSGDIYQLSEYGSRNVREFFAESFAARELGEQLPDYVESLMVEVLNGGIM